MSNFKFIHAADFHLDSPLAGLRKLAPEAAERLRGATRRAVERVVSLAIAEEVVALVIAGDLFDGPVRDSSSAIWLEGQFRKLTSVGISVVLIQGNHDAHSNAAKAVRWSSGIEQLRSDQAQSVLLDEVSLAIHGQSFSARSVTEDLAAEYPPANPGYFNVGVLHTSLSGHANHDDYAPTTVSVLDSKGYDYWALGHVHARSESSLSERCFVGYSGCIQGRHIREPGAKGVHLVSVQDGRLADVEFRPTDSVRWHTVQVSVSTAERILDIQPLVRSAVLDVLASEPSGELAIRVELSGPTALHSQFSNHHSQTQLSEVISDDLSELGDVWLERLRVKTLPDIEQMDTSAEVPLKYVSRVVEQLNESEVVRSDLHAVLNSLLKRTELELPELMKELEQEGAGIAGLAMQPIVAEAASLLTAKLMEGGIDEA